MKTKSILITKTTFYLLVGVILFSAVLSKSMYSQEFNPNELKVIHKKVDSLLQSYKLFNTFTEDDRQISQKYVDSFKKLFGDKKTQKNTLIFNDIEKTGYLEEKVSISEYIKSVKVFYKEGGLGITIKDVTYEKPTLIKPHENKIYVKPNKYKINVNIKKRVFGFFQNKSTFDETYDMTITITFNIRKKGFFDFIIQGVNSNETFIDDQSKECKYEAEFLLSPAVSRIVNKDKKFRNDYKSGFQLNLNLSYYYFKYKDIKIGAGIGLGLCKYRAKLFIKNYQETNPGIKDVDGNVYDLLVKANGSIDDIPKLTYFDVSVHLINFKNYKWLSNIRWFDGLEVSASTGFLFSFNISKKAEIKTSDLTTEGDYNGTIKSNDPNLGFYNNKEINEEYDIKISSMNVSYFGKIGISKPIVHNLSINVGFNYVYGLSNISGYGEDEKYIVERKDGEITNTYNSIMVKGSKTHTQMSGVYFGLSYKL